jgi:hypothetical protein
MLWILLWQFVTIIALAVLIVVGVIITKWILNISQRRNERLMYEELYGAHGVHNNDYLEIGSNVNNSVLMMDSLILPQQPQFLPGVMPIRSDIMIINRGAVNNSQDNILRVNSMGAVLFPDSFWDEENSDFEEHKESYMGHESPLMIDDIEKDLAQIAQYDFRIRRKTLADICEESEHLEYARKKSF